MKLSLKIFEIIIVLFTFSYQFCITFDTPFHVLNVYKSMVLMSYCIINLARSFEKDICLCRIIKNEILCITSNEILLDIVKRHWIDATFEKSCELCIDHRTSFLFVGVFCCFSFCVARVRTQLLNILRVALFVWNLHCAIVKDFLNLFIGHMHKLVFLTMM